MRFIHGVEEGFGAQYTRVASASAISLHLNVLEGLHDELKDLKSHKACFSCLMRMPEKVMRCGHAICGVCIRICGQRVLVKRNSFVLRRCVLCGVSNAKDEFRLMPPTAGPRILTLDGGGVRGVIPLTFLMEMEQRLCFTGCPLRDHFDLVCGTSSGGLIIMGIFLQQWTIDDCLEKFKTLSTTIFKRRINSESIFGRLHDFVQSYWADSRFDTSAIEDAFQRAYGPQVRMFNPITNDTKVAVLTTTARESHACLIANYNGFRRSKDASKHITSPSLLGSFVRPPRRV